MTLLLVFSAALADTYTVSRDDDSFAGAVAAAAAHAGPDIVAVAAGFNGADEGPVDLQAQELEIQANGATLPAMFGDGTTLRILDAAVTTTAPFNPGGSTESYACALCIERGDLTVDGFRFNGAEAGHGIIVVDTNLDATNLDIRGTWSESESSSMGAAVLVKALESEPSIVIADSSFSENGGGALIAFSATSTLPITLHNVTIDHAAGKTAGAMYLANIALTMDTTETADTTDAEGTIGSSSVTDSGGPNGPVSTFFLYQSSMKLLDVTLTGNGGTSAGLVAGQGSEVAITGGRISGNASSSHLEIVADKLHLSGVDWVPGGALSTTENLLVEDSTIDLLTSPAREFTHLVSAEGGSATLRGNTICGHGMSGEGVTSIFTVVGTTLSFTGNVVTELSPLSGSIFQLETTSASLTDNTFVGLAPGTFGAFLAGTSLNLDYENNLVSEGVVWLALDSVPSSGTVDYNLHFKTSGAWAGLPEGSDTHSVLADVDPLLVTTFDPAVCGSRPALRAGSPAINAGDPDLHDADDSRSDIGAVDFGSVPVDTGGDEDTAAAGVGGDPTVSYTGGCACGNPGTNPAAFGLVSSLLVLLRRRR